MRKTALALVFAGLATLSQAFTSDLLEEVQTAFLKKFPALQQAKLGGGTPDVSFNYDTKGLGPFAIGFGNNSIKLKPRLDMDYTLIAATNCTECPSHNYKDKESEIKGYL